LSVIGRRRSTPGGLRDQVLVASETGPGQNGPEGGREIDRLVGVQPKQEIARRLERAIA